MQFVIIIAEFLFDEFLKFWDEVVGSLRHRLVKGITEFGPSPDPHRRRLNRSIG
jgi:hypothetical protein